MKFLTFVSACVLAVSTLGMQGCTTYPTENANPKISNWLAV